MSPPTVDEDRLRAAYELLRDTVVGLSQDGDAVRDSEVKRKMQSTDASFDEAALGFRKFSFFLRQAHDEGVVNLEKTDGGNFFVSAIEAETGAEAKAAAPTEAATPTEAAPPTEKPAAEKRPATGRRSRRGGGRRGGSDRSAEAAKTRDAPAVPDAESATAPAAEDAIKEESAHEVVPDVEPEVPVQPEVPVEPEAPARPAPRRGGLGRYRRGSRGGAPAKPRPTTPSAGSRAAPAAEERTATERVDADVAADATPGSGKPPREERNKTAAAAPDANGGALVEHMVREYLGVGRKTAERIVEEFGDDTLQVIDTSPEKLSTVLPEARARAVIAARRAEREGQSGREG